MLDSSRKGLPSAPIGKALLFSFDNVPFAPLGGCLGERKGEKIISSNS